MKWREWGMFGLLGLIWGSSFLWIKVALGNDGQPVFGVPIPAGTVAFSPLMLVTMRVLFGLIGLAILMAVRQLPIPRNPRTLIDCAIVGLVNTALPFTLISWGEARIPSGIAAILNGTVPLFTIVIAHFVLHDERITATRTLGLISGFIGVVVLMSRGIGESIGSVWGQLAVVAAALSYAGAAAYSRRTLRGMSPLTQAFTTLAFAELFLLVGVSVFERPITLPRHPMIWVATAWLGLLGSCTAYLLYFSLINAWGATRATLVTYVFPVIGLLLGVVVLGESSDWRLIAGTGLVVGGIVVVNSRSLGQVLMPLARRRTLAVGD